MKIAIGSDHAGFELKNHLKVFLEKQGFGVQDVGAFNAESSDYPDFAEAVGKAVLDGKAERGLVVCGSGVGACIAANKLHGIRACICHDSYSARQGVEHDDMNVLVLGARVIGSALAEVLALDFLQAKFSNEERHVRRLKKVIAIESRN